MILYDGSEWAGVVFQYAGTIWPSIAAKFTVLFLYAGSAYLVALAFSYNFGTEGRTIFCGTMTFLLIFRANQAYTRYALGRTLLFDFFMTMREFIIQSMGYVRGGVYTSTFLFHGGPGIAPAAKYPEDTFDEKARAVRIDIVRLCVAICVALKLHTRIAFEGYCFGQISAETKYLVDWDRLRLRQLLTLQEFQLVDACVGIVDVGSSGGEDPLDQLVAQFRSHLADTKPTPPPHWPEFFEVSTTPMARPFVVLSFLVRETVLRNMNDSLNNQPWGIKERFVAPLMQLLTDAKHKFSMVDQIITTPLPLPYANLCKLMLSAFLLSMPFFIDYRLGWFANTMIPAVVSLALLGIDAIATELENPFGDDDNDLDVLELIGTLEWEALEMMRLTGDIQGYNSFVWRPIPEFMRRTSYRRLRFQLAARDMASSAEFGGEDADREVAGAAVAKWSSTSPSPSPST